MKELFFILWFLAGYTGYLRFMYKFDSLEAIDFFMGLIAGVILGPLAWFIKT